MLISPFTECATHLIFIGGHLNLVHTMTCGGRSMEKSVFYPPPSPQRLLVLVSPRLMEAWLDWAWL